MKHRTGSLWTGPCGPKPRPVLSNHQVWTRQKGVWLKLIDTIFLFWTLSITQFFKDARRFRSRLCFRLQANKHLTWWTAYIELFSVIGQHRNSNLLRYAPENKSSPRVITGKWLLKKYKLTTRLKNKTWTNPQITNHKNSYELRLIRSQTQHKNPEHTYLKFLTPLISVEKIVNLLHGFKLVYKPRNINVLFSQCGS